MNRHAYGTEQNWDLDNDAAPLAWGCTTGDTSAHVGVIDHRFDSTEIASNVTFGKSLLGQYRTDTTFHHGTFVANILGARGNDGIGMTGMMWRASLMLAETNLDTVTLLGLAKLVDSLAVHGAAIINISWGFHYSDSTSAKSDFYSLFAPTLRADALPGRW